MSKQNYTILQKKTITAEAAGTSTVLYLGDSSTDGTWRITISGDNLVFERRESGSYVEKSAVTP